MGKLEDESVVILKSLGYHLKLGTSKTVTLRFELQNSGDMDGEEIVEIVNFSRLKPP